MRTLTITAALLWVSTLALGQGPQTQTGEPTTGQQTAQAQVGSHPELDYVKYRVFFRHLANLDQHATEVEAKGKNGDGWRTHEQRAIGLNADEGTILKQIAYDCNQAVEDQDAKIKAGLDAFRAQYPHGQFAKVEPPQELVQLWQERTQIITSHIEQLKSALGGPSFYKVDRYVQTLYKTAVTTPPVPATSPTGGIKVEDPRRPPEGGASR